MATNPGVIPNLAKQIADAALNTRVVSANAQRNAAIANAQALKDAYGGLAKLQADIAPQVQSDYNAAKSSSAAFAKGYSDAFRQSLQANEAKANADLQRQAPGSAPLPSRAAPAADALYGFKGALPAGALNTAGLAMTAAARQAPVLSTGLGIQALQGGTNAATTAFKSAMDKAEAQYPVDLGNAALKVGNLQIAQDRLSLDKDKFTLDQRAKIAQITGFDPVTGEEYGPAYQHRMDREAANQRSANAISAANLRSELNRNLSAATNRAKALQAGTGFVYVVTPTKDGYSVEPAKDGAGNALRTVTAQTADRNAAKAQAAALSQSGTIYIFQPNKKGGYDVVPAVDAAGNVLQKPSTKLTPNKAAAWGTVADTWAPIYKNGGTHKIQVPVTAENAAELGYKGKQAKQMIGKLVWTVGNWTGGMTYDEALRTLVADNNVPLEVAIDRLNRVYSPGELGRPIAEPGSTIAGNVVRKTQGSLPTSTAGSQIVQLAQRWLGTPYSWGGGTPGGPTLGIGKGASTVGFDCSSFAQYLYKNALGVSIPRTTQEQINSPNLMEVPYTSNKDFSQLMPGDLIFFSMKSNDVDHVGIYVGEGKFIQSPHTGDVVKVSSLTDSTYAYSVAGVRRPKVMSNG